MNQTDSLTTREEPDRTYYATGVFLEAEDLLAEQTYHRGRLARALAYLHGDGTAAGLRVDWEGPSVEDPERDRVRVQAGLAVDRIGRLVEVPKPACVDLGRWLDHQRAAAVDPTRFPADALAPTAAAALPTSLSADEQALVVDVFVRFQVCERGRTPAFATGPFDAIDASVPSRLRDSYECLLSLRGGDGAGLPAARWPARGEAESFDAWSLRMRNAVLGVQGDPARPGAWRHGTEAWEDGQPRPDASTSGLRDASGQPDHTAVFLARLRIPVVVEEVLSAEGDLLRLPRRRTVADGGDRTVLVDNHSRRFAWSSSALLAWVEAARGTFAGP